jgi:hypothetical protein
MMADGTAIEVDSTVKRHSDRRQYLAMIARAHALGLKVSFKPLLFLVKQNPGEWHGTIAPSDTDRWFESFSKHLSYYLQIAEQGRVEEFTVGSELISMMTGYPDQHTSGFVSKWLDLIAMARKTYHGQIAYDFNFGVEFPTFYQRVMDGDESFTKLYKELDSIGYDSYQTLGSDADTVAPAALVDYIAGNAKSERDELAKMMTDMAAKTGVEKKLIIKEVGFKSTPKSYIDPWKYDDASLPVDLATQEAAYRAYLKVFMNSPQVGGIFWWDYPTHPGRGGPKDNGYTPRHKPTMAVIKEFWASETPSARGAR